MILPPLPEPLERPETREHVMRAICEAQDMVDQRRPDLPDGRCLCHAMGLSPVAFCPSIICATDAALNTLRLVLSQA